MLGSAPRDLLLSSYFVLPLVQKPHDLPRRSQSDASHLIAPLHHPSERLLAVGGDVANLLGDGRVVPTWRRLFREIFPPHSSCRHLLRWCATHPIPLESSLEPSRLSDQSTIA